VPKRYFTAGISAAGDVTVYDFGKKSQDIVLEWNIMSGTTKDSLKSYLMDTIKPFGTVSVTPDTNDDLQCGASGATNLTFIDFQAQYRTGTVNKWRVTVTVRKYS
jgi:hypothetical protein